MENWSFDPMHVVSICNEETYYNMHNRSTDKMRTLGLQGGYSFLHSPTPWNKVLTNIIDPELSL